MWQGAVMQWKRMPTALKSQRRRRRRKRGCPALWSRPHHIHSAWTSQSVQPTWTTARTSRAWSWWAETCARSPAVCVRHLTTVRLTSVNLSAAAVIITLVRWTVLALLFSLSADRLINVRELIMNDELMLCLFFSRSWQNMRKCQTMWKSPRKVVYVVMSQVLCLDFQGIVL